MVAESVESGLTDARLEELCRMLRDSPQRSNPKNLDVVDGLVDDVEATVHRLRASAQTHPSVEPPPELQRTLWLLGWLILEVGRSIMEVVPPGWGTGKSNADRGLGKRGLLLANRYTEAYLAMPWRDWAPRGIGILRSSALIFSKQDTDLGYVQAWERHRDAQNLHLEYSKSVQHHPRLRIGLDETQIQLRLGETGTACRRAERQLGRWGETEKHDGYDFSGLDEAEAIEDLFDDLYVGALSGREALQLVAAIEEKEGLVPEDEVGFERMAQLTAYQNPGIMTARAFMIMLPLCRARERDGGEPPDLATWSATHAFLLRGFEAGYRAVEREVEYKGELISLTLSRAFQMSLVQLRLGLALREPGISLPSKADFAPCLQHDPLDDQAVEALSAWLVDGGFDANIIGSATMPAYVRLVELERADKGAPLGSYAEWRKRWTALDRYRRDPNRAAWVQAALELAGEHRAYG